MPLEQVRENQQKSRSRRAGASPERRPSANAQWPAGCDGNRQPNGAMPNGDRTTAVPDPAVRRHSADERAMLEALPRGLLGVGGVGVDSRDAIVEDDERTRGPRDGSRSSGRIESCLLPIDGISGLPR